MYRQLKRAILSLALVLLVASTVHAQDSREACTRSELTPMLAASNPGLRDYRLLTSLEGEMRELVSIQADESLEIRQSGCEYVVATFRLKSKRLGRKDIEGAKAYLVAAELLRRLHTISPETVFSLDLAANTLTAAARRPNAVVSEDTFPVEGDGTDFLQTQVQLTYVGWRNGQAVVEFALFKGPL